MTYRLYVIRVSKFDIFVLDLWVRLPELSTAPVLLNNQVYIWALLLRPEISPWLVDTIVNEYGFYLLDLHIVFDFILVPRYGYVTQE